MPVIQVMLEVAPHIAMGLASGQLERVGGVIREAGSKQVVAWLREGGQIASNPDLANGLINILLDTGTGGLASVVTGAVNTVVTAHSHFLIMQQMARLETLISISAGIGVLNLATSLFSFAVLSKRLAVLEKEIEGLYDFIFVQFQEDRQAKLKAAILAAKNSFGMTKRENKVKQAHNAIDRFDEVRHFILADIEALFQKSPSLERTVGALVHAIDMDSLLIRCHLELDELQSARNHLHGYLNKYEKQVNELVNRCLGGHRASFFHESVEKAELYRFIAIEDWLHRDNTEWTSNETDDVWLKVLESCRKDFWNMSAIQGIENDNGPLKAFPTFKKDGVQMPTQLERITLAELLIEKYEGFRGFCVELERISRLGITYSEWERQQEEALAKAEVKLAEHDDYALLVDKDWLDKQSETTAA